MKLTVLNIETWKPTAVRQEILDRDGLYLIVQTSGMKSWALRYRRKSDGKAVKHTLGSYPAISLKAARAMATALRADIERGADPHGDKVATRHRATEINDSFDAVARRFIAEHQFRRNRSWTWAARVLGLMVDADAAVEPKTCPPLLVVRDGSKDQRGRRRVSLVDRWGARRIGDITRADVIAALDEIGGRTPILANRMHAVLGKLFRWADAKGISNQNPTVNIERNKEQSRERVLDDKELRAVWAAACKLDDPFADILRLLILTGQRRSEIAGLRWSEIDLEERLLHLPGTRTKNEKAHDVPLSAPALAIVAGRQQRLPGVDHVFTVGRKPVTGFSRMKEKLDAASGVTDWTVHDLRRTVASGLQKLGVRLEVTEAVLNHKSGSMAGMVKIYQVHDYAPEKRAALEAWANHVSELVETVHKRATNVTPYRRVKR
jgi:integrase